MKKHYAAREQLGDVTLMGLTAAAYYHAYAAATHYANDQYTAVGLTSDMAFGPNQTGVTLGIRHRF